MVNNNFKKDVGMRIRARREELRLSRERLAENSELSFQFLADIETGRSNMTTATLYKLARALNLSCDYIVFGTDNISDANEISTMLASLSMEDRTIAEDILRSFIKAVKK